jgi:hypothetical protein
LEQRFGVTPSGNKRSYKQTACVINIVCNDAVARSGVICCWIGRTTPPHPQATLHNPEHCPVNKLNLLISEATKLQLTNESVAAGWLKIGLIQTSQ